MLRQHSVLMRDVLIAALVTLCAFLSYIFIPGVHEHRALVAAVVNSIVVFGLLVKWTRPFWHQARLWLILTALLAGHIVLLKFLIPSAEDNIPGLAFVAMDVVECGIGLAIIRFAFINA